MNSARAIVIGDVMLDRYLSGPIKRISPEAPVPVVTVEHEWGTLGGAGNVAATLGGLGCFVTLAGIVGSDDAAQQLQRAISGAGIAQVALIEQNDMRTICKTRVVAAELQHVLRFDQDSDRATLRRASSKLEERILPSIRNHDIVVLSDYDKGTITETLTRSIISECRTRGIPCIVDSKKLEFAVFRGATMLTPNILEASRALGRSLDDDEQIASAAIDARIELELTYLLITRGSEGMTLASADGSVHFPAEVREVADVTGAGDTVTATLAACLGTGTDIKAACRIASVAAGIAVGHRGCYVVKAAELEAALKGRSPKVRDVETARRWAIEKRGAGRKIVFTNGCFDVLHAGHLASLEGARRLGDLLVVGLNSDESVRRLKGDSRPIISEENRAQLLAGLSCVDSVVIFEESTPEQLVRAIEPDVLVKGGDYRLEDIAGSDFVRSRGGTVVILPLVAGLSTTSILSKAGSLP